jgi:hypothetical protein
MIEANAKESGTMTEIGVITTWATIGQTESTIEATEMVPITPAEITIIEEVITQVDIVVTMINTGKGGGDGLMKHL